MLEVSAPSGARKPNIEQPVYALSPSTLPLAPLITALSLRFLHLGEQLG